MLMNSCTPKHFKKSLQGAQRGLDVTTIVILFPNIDFFKALSIYIFLLFSSSNPSKKRSICLSFYRYLAVSYFKCSQSLLSCFFVLFSPDKSLSLKNTIKWLLNSLSLRISYISFETNRLFPAPLSPNSTRFRFLLAYSLLPSTRLTSLRSSKSSEQSSFLLPFSYTKLSNPNSCDIELSLPTASCYLVLTIFDTVELLSTKFPYSCW